MRYGVSSMRADGRLILVSLGILCLDIDGVAESFHVFVWNAQLSHLDFGFRVLMWNAGLGLGYRRLVSPIDISIILVVGNIYD